MIPRLPCLSSADKGISLSFQVSGTICNLALAYSATPKKWAPWLLERHPLTMAYQAFAVQAQACQVCPQWQGRGHNLSLLVANVGTLQRCVHHVYGGTIAWLRGVPFIFVVGSAGGG